MNHNHPQSSDGKHDDDSALSDFLASLMDYTPTIPDELVEHYLAKSGFQCPDVRLIRLVAVATQKFVAEVASDALQHCKARQAAVVKDKRDKQQKDKRLILTMDDLSKSLDEYGVNVKHQEYFADSPSTGIDPASRDEYLGLESPRGLFLIVGVASISALIIFSANFLYEQRHVLFQFHSETSMWRKIRIMSRIFDQKDLSSHTFRKSELRDASSTCSVHSIGVVGSSSNTNCPPSPSTLSNQTDSSDFVFVVEQERLPGHGDLTPKGSASPDIFPSPARSSIELADYRHDP